ncbi:hypothetical protein PFISCL1PPCAC_17638, partial [Pristionchus fissidentatus]
SLQTCSLTLSSRLLITMFIIRASLVVLMVASFFHDAFADEDEKECNTWSICSTHSECGSGGTCSGAFAGKCNCNPCVNLWMCLEDGECGGLEGACDKKAGVCRCAKALEEHGFPFLKAATELCNVKRCKSGANDCFGLPCNNGRCVC